MIPLKKNCNCDSEYMSQAMDRVGKAIRDKYYWIPSWQPCYIINDNAGGHCTVEAIEIYTDYLHIRYNISLIHQVLRSPYTNLLDLGVWRSLYAIAEKAHRGKRYNVESLGNTVIQTWETGKLDDTITKVHDRLKIVLSLIVEDNGANDFVHPCVQQP